MKAYKIEITLVLIAVAFAGFFYSSTQTLNLSFTKQKSSIVEEGYIMPRLRSLMALFSLENRDVDYKLVNPFADQAARTPAKKELVKDAVKKDDKKAATGSPLEQAKKQEAAKAAAAKAKIKTNVVQESDRYKNSNTVTPTEPTAEVVTPIVQAQVKEVAEVKTPQAPAVPGEGTVLEDPSYWKAQLMAQPTPAQAYRFVEAYNKKQITEAAFYEVVQSLAQSTNPAHQKLSIYIIYNQTSAKAFAVVARTSVAMSEEAKAIAERYLTTYSDAQKVGVLAGLLSSPEKSVQTKALSVITAGLAKIKTGVNPSSEERSDRAPFNSNAALAAYLTLVPALQQLAVNQDATIAQQAVALLSQLQTVAAN